GRRPAVRSQRVRPQIPDRARACLLALQPEELVELAGARVEDQRVAIAAVLDVDLLRDRIRAGVALVGVPEPRLRPLLDRRPVDDVVRDPDGTAGPLAGAEVG